VLAERVSLTVECFGRDASEERFAELIAFQVRYGRASVDSVVELRAFLALVTEWMGVFVRDVDGVLVAVGDAIVLPGVPTSRDLRMNATVRDGSSGAGLRAVLDAIGAWEHGRACAGLCANVTLRDEGVLALWEDEGFEQIGERARLRRPIASGETPPEVVVPEGMRIVALRDVPHLEPEVDIVWHESAADIPSATPQVVTELSAREQLGMSVEGDAPETWIVAVTDADEIAGFAYLHLYTSPGATAGHRMTGVARAFRGRGVARALKTSLLAWAIERGLDELQASNDEHSHAMRHINDDLGYVVDFRAPIMRRER